VQVEELATAKERNRLAREIHDSLGHYLTVINVQIEAARAVIGNDPPRALDALRKAQSLAQEGLADVRRSVAALRASPTEDRPLPEALAALAAENRASGLLTELAVTGAPRPLPPQTELTLYRAMQEGLTNIRKHARAARVDITLDYGDNERVRLVVHDNGVGDSPDGRPGGYGLLGVRERTHLLGGEVRIRSAEGQGFTLEVELPG
jgi:signal transduction histidine kinase